MKEGYSPARLAFPLVLLFLLISFCNSAFISSLLVLFLCSLGPALLAESPLGKSFDLPNLSYLICKMG